MKNKLKELIKIVLAKQKEPNLDSFACRENIANELYNEIKLIIPDIDFCFSENNFKYEKSK